MKEVKGAEVTVMKKQLRKTRPIQVQMGKERKRN